jgi:hypothetical protein
MRQLVFVSAFGGKAAATYVGRRVRYCDGPPPSQDWRGKSYFACHFCVDKCHYLGYIPGFRGLGVSACSVVIPIPGAAPAQFVRALPAFTCPRPASTSQPGNTASVGVPLPSLLFLSSVFSSFVIAGLDPAIHAASPLVQMVSFDSLRVSMDHRVKPGGDEEGAWLFENRIGKRTRRGSGPLSPAVRRARATVWRARDAVDRT